MKLFLVIQIFIFSVSQNIQAQDKTLIEHLTPLRWSLGVSAGVNVAGGAGMGIEMLNFGESGTEMAFYCAPIAGFSTNIEAGVSASIIKPMGYYAPEDYSGYVLNIGVNLPFKIGGIQYTFGSAFNQALDILEKQKKYGDFEPSEIPGEILRFLDDLGSSNLSVLEKSRILTITCQVSNYLPKSQKISRCENQPSVSFTDLSLPSDNIDSPDSAKSFSEWVQTDYQAMYTYLKSLAQKKTFSKRAPNFHKFYSAIVKTIATTGSITISMGLSATVLPGSFTMSLGHFHLIQKSTSIHKKFQRLMSRDPKQIAVNFLENFVDTALVAKSLGTLCWPSTKILASDTQRLYKILMDPVPQVTKEIDVESYFSLK